MAGEITPLPAVGSSASVPTPEPEVLPTPAPATIEAAPAPVEPAAPAAPVIPEAAPSLLELHDADKAPAPVVDPAKPADPAAEAKPADAPAEAPKPEAEAKPAEPAPEPAAIEPVVYEPFVLPEGVSADPEIMTAYTELVGGARIPQETAQKLVDLHTAAAQKFASSLIEQQHSTFAETRRGWQKQVMADEELGGASHHTTMGAIARMRDRFVPEEHRAEFNTFMRVTGAGDHPAMLRLLHNVARTFDEPAPPPPDSKPTATNGVNPNRSRSQILYDRTKT